MTIDYSIDEKDYLIHQLFLASKSDRIKKKRRKSQVFLSVIYVAIGLLFFYEGVYPMAFVFFVIAILWFLLYPIWEKRQYVKHYEGFIKENYSESIEKNATLEISNEYLLAKDESSEGKVLMKEIIEICEISTTIFIRFKGGQSIILPKDKISNINQLIERLKELASYLNIKYDIDEKWEWK